MFKMLQSLDEMILRTNTTLTFKPVHSCLLAVKEKKNDYYVNFISLCFNTACGYLRPK